MTVNELKQIVVTKEGVSPMKIFLSSPPDEKEWRLLRTAEKLGYKTHNLKHYGHVFAYATEIFVPPDDQEEFFNLASE